jgi:hypothetical protein
MTPPSKNPDDSSPKLPVDGGEAVLTMPCGKVRRGRGAEEAGTGTHKGHLRRPADIALSFDDDDDYETREDREERRAEAARVAVESLCSALEAAPGVLGWAVGCGLPSTPPSSSPSTTTE